MQPNSDVAGNVLAGLQELPLPEPVSYMPATTGWVVVACMLLIALIYAGWRFVRHWRANAYRREALAEFRHLEAELLSGSAHTTARRNAWQALPVLLKRTAIAATSRERVSALTGRDWLRFLDRTLDTHSFSQGSGRLLTRVSYDERSIDRIPREDLEQLLRLSRRWIRHHHADL